MYASSSLTRRLSSAGNCSFPSFSYFTCFYFLASPVWFSWPWLPAYAYEDRLRLPPVFRTQHLIRKDSLPATDI